LKKLILMTLLLSIILQAQSFTKDNILGVWELSSKKLNGFTSFGKEFSENRGESYTLVFNKKGLVKNVTTGAIYNYEIINGNLRIYQTKIYNNNYKVKDTRHYDLWTIDGSYEGCILAKIKVKKMMGYYRKEGYRFCKLEEYPQPTFQSSIVYDF